MNTRMRMLRTMKRMLSATMSAATISAFFVNSSSALSSLDGRISGEVLLDGLLDAAARNGADDAAPLFPILEEHEQRNALHTELRRGAGVVVDVHFRESHIGTFRRQFVDDGRHHVTRPAPPRPE